MSFSTVSRIRGKQPVAQGTVSRIRGSASARTQATVSRIHGRIRAGLAIDAGTVQVVEPFVMVTLDPSITDGAAPDTWTWTQTSGPAVTLTVDLNGQAVFKAPANLTPSTLAFQVRASLAGYPDAIDSTTVTVRAHTHFRYNLAGDLVGIEGIETAGYGGATPAGTGLGLAPLGTSPLGA